MTRNILSRIYDGPTDHRHSFLVHEISEHLTNFFETLPPRHFIFLEVAGPFGIVVLGRVEVDHVESGA